MRSISTIDSSLGTIVDGVPLIGEDITRNHTVNLSSHRNSTTNTYIIVTGNINSVGRNNVYVESSGNALTTNTSLSNNYGVVCSLVVNDRISYERRIGFTIQCDTVLVPLIRRSTITTSNVSNQSGDTTVTYCGRITLSNSNSNNRISNNSVVNNIGHGLTTIRRGNYNPVRVSISSLITGSGVGRSSSDRLSAGEVAVPSEGIAIQTVNVSNATINSSRERSGTAYTGDSIVDSSHNLRIRNHRDSSSLRGHDTTRSSGNNHRIVVRILVSGRRNCQRSIRSTRDQNIVDIPLITILNTSRCHVGLQRGGTTFANGSVANNLDSHNRSRNNRHNSRSRSSGNTSGSGEGNRYIISVSGNITIDSNRRLREGSHGSTRDYNTVTIPSVNRVTIRSVIVGNSHNDLTTVTNLSVVEVYNRSCRSCIHMDGDRINSVATGSRLRSSHVECIVTRSGRIEGISRTNETVRPGVNNIVIVVTSRFSSDNGNTTLADSSLSSSQLNLRSELNSNYNSRRRGRTTIGGSINSVRTRFGNNQNAISSARNHNVILVPNIGSRNVRRNICI